MDRIGRGRWLVLATLVLAVASHAGAQDMEMLMRQVRLTTEPAVTQGCTKITTVSDDSVKDLRRKIVRAGGNTGLLAFSAADLSRIYAEVFRCATVSPAPAAPPHVPPPPPGPPPPPPPSGPPPPPPPPR
jgi:hypothetical protein